MLMIIACNGLKWPVEAVQRCRFNKLALGSLVVRLKWWYVSWTDHHLSDILEGTGERATNCVSYLPVCCQIATVLRLSLLVVSICRLLDSPCGHRAHCPRGAVPTCGE